MIHLKDILLEGMSVDVADTIFQKFGIVKASTLDKGKLKDYYIALVKKHHPDAGGSNDDMRYINAAYDVLKKSPARSGSHGGYKTPNCYAKRDNDDGHAGWAQAGYSGGYPDSGQIYNENFHDLNYCRKMAWEISGRPPFDNEHTYRFSNWDGSYFRGVFSVYAVPERLYDISLMMSEWDSDAFRSVAVFFSKKTNPGKMYLINLRGKEVKPPKEFNMDDFSESSTSSASFESYLRKNL